jgi:hypothetical protein
MLVIISKTTTQIIEVYLMVDRINNMPEYEDCNVLIRERNIRIDITENCKKLGIFKELCNQALYGKLHL